MVKDIFASTEALAFLTEGGVVTWSVYEEEMVAHLHLGAVKDCVGSFFSFAFLFRDGSVKSWGSKAYGGDSSEVSEELSRDVLAIEHRGIFERGFGLESEFDCDHLGSLQERDSFTLTSSSQCTPH